MMNKINPSFICLQDVNTKYKLGREYKFYGTGPWKKAIEGQQLHSGKKYHLKFWLLEQPSKW